MFINLIRNSMQADASEVNISVNIDNGNYIIYFEDNGKGIPETSIEKIFEPGFTTKEKGMGIGLKITKRYIESIGGEINPGTNFCQGNNI